MSYQLSKNILATVTYYDVLRFPLTSFEIWKHLIVYGDEELCGMPVSLGEVVRVLGREDLRLKLEEKDGFYFLRGRGELVEKRIRAEKVSVAKLKRMRALARRLSWIPYLRMLSASGSLSMKNGSPKSDWDMFVVLKSGRIWSGRTFLTAFLHLIGKRRHGKKVVDRACLNYFVAENNQEIATKDLFSANEYRFLIPLLFFRNFQTFERKNAWIRRYKPQYMETLVAPHWAVPLSARAEKVQQALESAFDVLAPGLERMLAGWQKKKIARNPKTALQGSLIEASDRALIFLPHPRGPKVFDEFKHRLSV